MNTDLAAEVTNRTNADALKENTANKSTTTTLGTSNVLFPTQNAVKTYVDGSISTSNTATTASIAAVQADVDANETAANTAIAAVQADVDANETAANTAIAAVQADVDANETASIAGLALKENTANKSTATTLGTSNVLFPTQNAVKTYVDGSITTSNTANTAAIAAVQADVDANETAANTAIAAVQADVDANETASIAGLALKENTANKSTATTLGTSDVLFPTQKAVKTYVDTYSTINAISTVTANYTALITDYTILSSCATGAITLTLPSAANSTGKVYVIRKIDDTDNLLNFSPALKQTETITISSLNFPKTIRIQSNGSSWYVID